MGKMRNSALVIYEWLSERNSNGHLVFIFLQP